jgi:DNA mismatch endonuclease (patch repair protein)
MVDTFNKELRSEIMSKIHSKNTRLEIKFRKILWKRGLRYRIHYRLIGKPDIVFVTKKIAIFLDSCFWHKCPYHFREPKSNKKYWVPKMEKNSIRDKKVTRLLKKEGWVVLRFWEHEIKNDLDDCIEKICIIYNKR